jgi:cell division protein FtsB
MSQQIKVLMLENKKLQEENKALITENHTLKQKSPSKTT